MLLQILLAIAVLLLIGQQSGNTVVLGVPASSGPIPIHTPGAAAIDSHGAGAAESENDA